MPRQFPHELEPDGDRWLPHHWWLGLAMMAGGFGLWTGGTALEGALIAGLGLAIAADDYLSHAFGWWTPLDALFKWAMKNPRFRRVWRRVILRYRRK